MKTFSPPILPASYAKKLIPPGDLLPGVVTPEQFGAIGDGVANDYVAMQAAIATGKNVFAGQKYKLNGPSPAIHMVTVGQTLFGAGDGSEILTDDDITLIKVNAEHTEIRDLNLIGNAVGAAQFGIASSDLVGGAGANFLRITNVTITSFATAGVLFFNGSGGTLQYGPHLTNCYISSCGIGWWCLNEYSSMVGCTVSHCNVGLQMQAGNLTVVGSVITFNNTGVRVTVVGNDGHGVVSGCAINHNNIQVSFDDGITNGMPFVGCNIYGVATGIVIGTAGAVGGARFIGCAIDVATINVAANSDVLFASCLWPQNVIPGPPVITAAATAGVRFDAFNVDLTGQLPAFIQAFVATVTNAWISLLQGMTQIASSVAAPAAPATGFYLFIDAADGALKVKGSGGTVTPLALP